MTTRQRLSTGLLLGFTMLVAAACGSAEGESQQRGNQEPQPYPVLTMAPRSIVLATSYPATLEGEQTIEIRPRVQGYIIKMNVDEGDEVSQGQVLFELNREEYQQAVRSAEADVESAQAAVQTARDEVERYRGLTEQDIVSDYELKSARNTLQQRRAALNQAEAALTNAKVDLGYTYVKSPVDGVIGEIPYRIGSLVSSTSQQPLTVVSDVSDVYAYFSMSEGELLAMNQAAGGDSTRSRREREALRSRIETLPQARLVLTDGSTYPIEGDVRLASGLINTQTGSASFRAMFPNPQRVLRSGATANVRLPFQRDSALVVPKSATYEIQDRRFVYQVRDSLVQGTEIQIAELSTPRLYVVESGLERGARIVTEGMGSLQDSTKIVPQPVNADSLYQALTTIDQARSIASSEGGANQSGPPNLSE